MSKKKSKPAKSKKTSKGRTGKKGTLRFVTPKAPKRTQSPRSQVLPGMEQVRNRSLDRICEGISDVRGDKNRLIGEEKDLMNQAVTVMQRDKVSVYRFHGVELVLVPGDVHLRVRTLKDKPANADAQSEAAPDDTGVTAEELTPDDERLAESDGDEDAEA